MRHRPSSSSLRVVIVALGMAAAVGGCPLYSGVGGPWYSGDAPPSPSAPTESTEEAGVPAAEPDDGGPAPLANPTCSVRRLCATGYVCSAPIAQEGGAPLPNDGGPSADAGDDAADGGSAEDAANSTATTTEVVGQCLLDVVGCRPEGPACTPGRACVEGACVAACTLATECAERTGVAGLRCVAGGCVY
jgi:hypothetical protein